MGNYKNFVLGSSSSVQAEIVDGELIISSEYQGDFNIAFRAEFLDGEITNLGSFNVRFVLPYLTKLTSNLPSDTMVGKYISYSLGSVESVSSVRWYTCPSARPESTNMESLAGCSLINGANTSRLLLAQSHTGKYVRAVMITNEGLVMSPTSSVVYGKPSAVSKVSATSKSRTIKASWSAGLANGSPISGYKIQLINSANKVVKTVYVSGSSFTHTFTSLSRRVNYKVKVVAINAAGEGSSKTSSPIRVV